MSKSQPFSGRSLLNAARIDITDKSSDRAGVYERFHSTKDKIETRKNTSTYLYVGKVADFGDKLQEHKDDKSSYGDLTRNSTTLAMIALCELNDSQPDSMFYLTEQIFVCLLQTYRKDVVPQANETKTDANLDYLKFLQAARYFTDVSKAVVRLTGWQGGVERESFGIQNGTNCSSPLLEYGT
jgi:hypothetical protein